MHKFMLPFRLMREEPAGEPAGGGGTPPAQPAPNPAPNVPEPPVEGEGDTGNGADDGKPNPGLDPNGGGQNPAPVEDSAYVEGIKPDEGAEYKFNGDFMKGMIPHFREAGLTPEQANKLANSFAKMSCESRKGEIEAIKKLYSEWTPKVNDMVRENPSFWKEVNAAIGHYFSDDPASEHLIRYTEIGRNPGFLRMLADAGRVHTQDGGVGTTAGAASRDVGFAEALSGGVLRQ